MSAADNTFNIKEGDTLPPLVERLFDADGPLDLTTATAIDVEIRLVSGGTLVKHLGAGVEVIGDPSAGWIKCSWSDGDIAVVGHHIQEVHVTFASGGDVTIPNTSEGYPFIVAKQAVAG